MADQEKHDADAEQDADTEVDAGTDEEVDVEGFGFEYKVISPRDHGMASASGLGGVAGGTDSGIAIKENGIK